MIGNHDDWWLEDRSALNLFESLEPHDTVEIEGLGTVNLSHYPYREDLAYSWPDDVAKFSAARRCRLTVAGCCMDIHISFRQMVHARRH
nr:hypothetical protein [uncultured Bifidobacterium sp.]